MQPIYKQFIEPDCEFPFNKLNRNLCFGGGGGGDGVTIGGVKVGGTLGDILKEGENLGKKFVEGTGVSNTVAPSDIGPVSFGKVDFGPTLKYDPSKLKLPEPPAPPEVKLPEINIPEPAPLPTPNLDQDLSPNLDQDLRPNLDQDLSPNLNQGPNLDQRLNLDQGPNLDQRPNLDQGPNLDQRPNIPAITAPSINLPSPNLDQSLNLDQQITGSINTEQFGTPSALDTTALDKISSLLVEDLPEFLKNPYEQSSYKPGEGTLGQALGDVSMESVFGLGGSGSGGGGGGSDYGISTADGDTTDEDMAATESAGAMTEEEKQNRIRRLMASRYGKRQTILTGGSGIAGFGV